MTQELKEFRIVYDFNTGDKVWFGHIYACHAVSLIEAINQFLLKCDLASNRVLSITKVKSFDIEA